MIKRLRGWVGKSAPEVSLLLWHRLQCVCYRPHVQCSVLGRREEELSWCFEAQGSCHALPPKSGRIEAAKRGLWCTISTTQQAHECAPISLSILRSHTPPNRLQIPEPLHALLPPLKPKF